MATLISTFRRRCWALYTVKYLLPCHNSFLMTGAKRVLKEDVRIQIITLKHVIFVYWHSAVQPAFDTFLYKFVQMLFPFTVTKICWHTKCSNTPAQSHHQWFYMCYLFQYYGAILMEIVPMQGFFIKKDDLHRSTFLYLTINIMRACDVKQHTHRWLSFYCAVPLMYKAEL